MKLPSKTKKIIGITRIYEIWHEGREWKQINPTELDNGMHVIRIRYTDEDQRILDIQKAEQIKK